MRLIYRSLFGLAVPVLPWPANKSSRRKRDYRLEFSCTGRFSFTFEASAENFQSTYTFQTADDSLGLRLSRSCLLPIRLRLPPRTFAKIRRRIPAGFPWEFLAFAAVAPSNYAHFP